MSELPLVTGADAVRAFCKLGYDASRIKGSHHVLKCPGRKTLSIPVHRGKFLGRGLLSTLIKDSGFSREEFIAALD